MTAEFSVILRSRLSEFVADHLGLDFPQERWADLERGVRAAARDCSGEPVSAYVQRLLSSTSSPMVEVLAKHLTVGETYFFREPYSFDFLRQEIVPEVICTGSATMRRLRIWSAGCATGEEPYSVAILLSRLIPELRDWSISILATDVNVRSVEKAIAGTYSKWSFRSTPTLVRSAYFTLTGDNRWTIVPVVKNMVAFACLNLAADHYPSPFDSADAFDIILCRNVLMYFTPEAAKKVIRRLYRALAPGGWLMVGVAEASHALFSEVAAGASANGAVYRKPARDLTAAVSCGLQTQPETAGLSLRSRLITGQPGSAEFGFNGGRATSTEVSRADVDTLLLPDTFTSCKQRRYQDTEAVLGLARLLANQQELRAALRWCDNAIGIDKMDGRAHYLRAVILQEQGLWEEAAIALRRAVYVNPKFVLAHLALGNLAVRQKRPEESRRCFGNALELLSKYQQEDVLPEFDGLTAGRLRRWAFLQLDRATAMEIDR
jgi:chemotaxis protein methyltransferase CheR